MTSVLSMIGRDHALLENDIENNNTLLCDVIANSRFLILGGAGSIGQAVSKEIFKRQPKKLHIVDISENNMVELVRDIRSSLGYMMGEFKTFSLDIGSIEYDAFIQTDGAYDYVLNLSALKHVRSEKDPFTLMRMIDVNILNTKKTLLQSSAAGVKKYFCVSTDKAANPINMMGASKRIMEMFLMHYSQNIAISTARFANVAFSDGSLLYGFDQRIKKQQPIVAPKDIHRYFLTAKEAGELCLMSCILGENRDVFFPKFDARADLISFADIAVRYVKSQGFDPYLCSSEQEARELMATLPQQGMWPCLFTLTDTSGEKPQEEFYVQGDELDMQRFECLGIIKNSTGTYSDNLDMFEKKIAQMKADKQWKKLQIVELFKKLLSNFEHDETGKYLESKM